ncbi:MAG: hypothetical protein WCT32_00195 [Patescibacteria group bacterium]|jgi:hypothetical protein
MGRWILVHGRPEGGRASAETKLGWINCVLGVIDGDERNGFCVDAKAALQVLANESPDFAAWFFENEPEMLDPSKLTTYAFNSGCCQVVHTPFVVLPRRFRSGIEITFGQAFDHLHVACNDISICRSYLDIARERAERIHPGNWPTLRQYPLSKLLVLRLFEIVAFPARTDLSYYIGACSSGPYNKIDADCLEYFRNLYLLTVKAGIELRREEIIIPVGPVPEINSLIADDFFAVDERGFVRVTEKGERMAHDAIMSESAQEQFGS